MRAAKLSVLFVCSRNQWRSPTAEKIYENDGRVNARSRGTARSAVRRITPQDIAWSDLVMVMEEKHRKQVLADYPDLAQLKPIHVLDIPDLYQSMDVDLIDLIQWAAEPIINHASTR